MEKVRDPAGRRPLRPRALDAKRPAFALMFSFDLHGPGLDDEAASFISGVAPDLGASPRRIVSVCCLSRPRGLAGERVLGWIEAVEERGAWSVRAMRRTGKAKPWASPLAAGLDAADAARRLRREEAALVAAFPRVETDGTVSAAARVLPVLAGRILGALGEAGPAARGDLRLEAAGFGLGVVTETFAEGPALLVKQEGCWSARRASDGEIGGLFAGEVRRAIDLAAGVVGKAAGLEEGRFERRCAGLVRRRAAEEIEKEFVYASNLLKNLSRAKARRAEDARASLRFLAWTLGAAARRWRATGEEASDPKLASGLAFWAEQEAAGYPILAEPGRGAPAPV